METLTLKAAQNTHNNCEVVEVIDRADNDGAAQPAIYVWQTAADAENDDGARCVAIYWLGN